MKRLSKIFLALILAVCCVFALVGCDEKSNLNVEKGLLVKVLKGDDYYTVYGYIDDGETTSLDMNVFFSADSGKKIGRISAGAFSGNSSLKEIILPDTLQEIDAGAFSGMKALEKITLPFVGAKPVADAYYNQNASEDKAVDAERTFAYIFGTEEYEGGALVSCSHNGKDNASYYIPATLTKITVKSIGKVIPMYAFYGLTQITTISIEGNVEDIGEFAFAECKSLETVNLPATLKNIYKNAFECCSSLKTYNDATKKGLNFASGTALDFIGDDILKESSVDKIELSVKVLDESAFAKTGLKTVNLTDVTEIGAWAFYGCKNISKTEIMINGSKIASCGLDVPESAYADCMAIS